MSRPAGEGGTATVRSFVDLLHRRAAEQGEDQALVFLPDRGGERASLTFAGLRSRAQALAGRLAAEGEPGDRAALLLPPGLDFLVAFFACFLARIIAVPMMLPRRDGGRDASRAILADCAPRFLVTTREVFGGGRAGLAGRISVGDARWIFVEDSAAEDAGGLPEPPRRSDIALLQYTSGSTSAPRGAIVTHGNLLENSEMTRIATGNTRRSTYVSWLPLYHDMGLVANALQAFYNGALFVLMSPVRFLQRPLIWLRAISDYGGEVAGGPNFAYDHCVRRYRAEEMEGVDLSGWRVAFNGAEPVRAETIARFAATFAPHGFAPEAVYPGYGMAEATLLIAGGQRGRGAVFRPVSRTALHAHRIAPPASPDDDQILVGCGRALVGEELAIVDPAKRRLASCQIGEIWIAGPHVAQGYWRNPEATGATFGACIAGDSSARWLRSGDLGFLDEDGELYITGRIKDLIIIRGINHYPQDIEATVENCHPALRRHGGAAFLAEEAGEERLVIVQELERGQRRRANLDEVVAVIRDAVTREHDVAPWRILLIRPGALPQTTSGKIQRGLARQLWLAGALDVVG